MHTKIWSCIFGSIGTLLLILDTKTAIFGAQDAIKLCLMSVIPSLFPFLLASRILTNGLAGKSPKSLRFLSYLLRIPQGSEPLFLIGLLGGYPAGAQAVTDAYKKGLLSRSAAHRMLGFCSNAGPAFIFGITAFSFSDPKTAWVLWIIHITSAVLVGMILPGGSKEDVRLRPEKGESFPQILKNSVNIMAQICGWILIFRVILSFFRRWFLWLFETPVQIAIGGALELTIGCAELFEIPNQGLRLILCAGFLGFGGLCVAMQTLSVTQETGIGMYFPGKILQCMLSILLASVYQGFCFAQDDRVAISPLLYLLIVLFIPITVFFLHKLQKKSSNSLPISV